MSGFVPGRPVCFASNLGEARGSDRGMGVVLGAAVTDDPRVHAAADSCAP